MPTVSPHLRRALAVAAIILIAGLPPAEARMQSPFARLKQTLNSIVDKIRGKQAQIHKTAVAKQRTEDRLADCQGQLDTARNQVASCRDRLSAARAAVAEAEQRLKAARAKLKLQQGRFSQRIAASYTEGPVSYADVLLGARDFNDFLDRQYYVEKIAHRDSEVLGSVRAAKQQVADERVVLLKRQQTLLALEVELAAHEQQVAVKTNQQQQLLTEITGQLRKEKEELDELEQDSRRVEGQIRRAMEARRRAARAHPESYRELPSWTGFHMPVAGRITSGFGMRYHPMLHAMIFHSGIDFAVPFGTPIHAAASGEVMLASLNGGYGLCIIILHGNRMQTLYGHCSRLAVHAGQMVHRGEIIGYVGSTGRSTGPHLHFEVRRDGHAINPL
jgi:murein DD-endopeptidase MepM/ murein hydrolase activator NlpD